MLRVPTVNSAHTFSFSVLPMTTLQEIEAAITQLSETDARQLSEWLQDYLDESWDRQIEQDLESGKLDRLIAKAEAEIASSQVRDLDEILRNG
jgi:hypothetical protein